MHPREVRILRVDLVDRFFNSAAWRGFETTGMTTWLNRHAHCLREALGDCVKSLAAVLLCFFGQFIHLFLMTNL